MCARLLLERPSQNLLDQLRKKKDKCSDARGLPGPGFKVSRPGGSREGKGKKAILMTPAVILLLRNIRFREILRELRFTSARFRDLGPL